MAVERFDDQARRAVSRARQVAQDLQHDQVGTEHLLLGLVDDGRSDAGRALVACGVTFEACRAKVTEAVANERRGSPASELTFTDRANLALERAGRMSLRQRREQVGTRHVLLSLLDVEGTAGQVLRGMAVDPERVRRELERVDAPEPNAGPAAAAGPQAPPVEPRCPGCQKPLGIPLARRPATVRVPGGSEIPVVLVYCSDCGATIGVLPDGPAAAEAGSRP